jgi:hypothetical protein
MKAAWVTFLTGLLFLGTTIIAMGQELIEVPMDAQMVEEVCTGLVCEVMKGFPEVNAWLIAVFTFIGLILRAAADLLGFISDKLKHENAGAWAKKLSGWSVQAAKVIGWFGGGTPKIVLEQKVEKALGKAGNASGEGSAAS